MMMIMGRRCEDCGNQAKKECLYMRCRTCCKSKAFHCQTHIKSTWVPTYRRSHKHQTQTQSQSQTRPFSTSTIPKRLRELQLPPASNASPSSSGVQIHNTPGHFPAELTSMANFRCIKVSSIEDGKEQYAYQTTIIIGGHIFKGILHDQGLDKVMLDHPYDNTKYHQDLVSSSTSSTCPLMITSPFTDFMSCTQFSSHQKP